MNNGNVIDDMVYPDDIIDISISLEDVDPRCMECGKVLINCYECGVYICDSCLSNVVDYCELTGIYMCNKCNDSPYSNICILNCTECSLKRCTVCTIFYNCKEIICYKCKIDKVCKSCKYDDACVQKTYCQCCMCSATPTACRSCENYREIDQFPECEYIKCKCRIYYKCNNGGNLCNLCIKECIECKKYIDIKNDYNTCNPCKFNMIYNTKNTITTLLPIEIVNNICCFI